MSGNEKQREMRGIQKSSDQKARGKTGEGGQGDPKKRGVEFGNETLTTVFARIGSKRGGRVSK